MKRFPSSHLFSAELFPLFKKHFELCKVKKGEIPKADKLHLRRGGEIIGDLKIKSMKRKKEEIIETKKGKEFGAVFTPALDFKIGDSIIAYKQSDS